MLGAMHRITELGWTIHLKAHDEETHAWITRSIPPEVQDKRTDWPDVIRYDAYSDMVTCVDQLSVIASWYDHGYYAEMPDTESYWHEDEGWTK